MTRNLQERSGEEEIYQHVMDALEEEARPRREELQERVLTLRCERLGIGAHHGKGMR